VFINFYLNKEVYFRPQINKPLIKKQMKLNQKFCDLHAETDISVPYLNITGTSARLDIKDTRKTSVNEKKADFDGKYTIYISPLTHTEDSVINVESSFVILDKEMKGLNNMMKHDMDITLTGADITAFHIHEDAEKRHKVPAPNFAPTNMLLKQTHLVNRISTINPTDGHQADKHRPDDVAKIGRTLAYNAIGDSEPASDKFNPMATIGAVQYNIVSGVEHLNQQGWLITWYISPSGEVGPPSRAISFIVI